MLNIIKNRARYSCWNILKVFFVLALFMYGSVHKASAGTDIGFTGKIPAITYDLTDIKNEVQGKSDLNGPHLSNAFALANITGYPNGSATIGTFPHFEVGVSAGAGCTNMEYFDDTSPASEDGSLPMIIPNPVLHFGFGIIGGLDFIGKIFLFDSSMYSASYENDLATPEEYSLYSVGGRVRYNILPRFTIVPALFSFGGITLSAGADGMIGRIIVHGTYDAYLEDIEVSGGGLPPDYSINRVDFTGDYEANVSWKVISGTVTGLAYFDFFTIFTFYTGFGVTVGTGFFSIDFEGNGLCSTTDAIYTGIVPSGEVGTLTFTSKNKYKAHPFIPAYILGAEVSLLVFKLHIETMVNLYTGKDVTALIGARIQF